MTLRLRFCRWRLLAAASVVLLATGSAVPAFAQFDGRFERFLERLDRDGNRVLDADELNQIQGPFRGMLESNGVDLSRSISTEELSDRLRRRSEQRESDRGRDSERERDSERGRDFGRGGFGRDGGRDSGERDDRGSSSRASQSRAALPHSAIPKSLVKREKTIVVLPAQYAAGDADHDGQIALSEWKTWKGRAALAEFARLDTNSDGFLTPRELLAGTSSKAVATTTVASASTPASTETVTPVTTAANSTSTDASASPSPNAKPATDAKPVDPAAKSASQPKVELDESGDPDGLSAEASDKAPAEPTGETADAARRFFGILDQDRDGKVSPKEWAASNRIRGLFATAKIDLTQPMPRADFIAHYMRLAP